jgi:predicted metal-dependent phosphoesterase TrpH
LKLADLHIHTQASDGWLGPSVAVEHANRAGLTAVSIADHDSVAGIDAAIEAGEKHGVEVIPGVELSSGFGGRELHILGYFIDWRDKWLQNKLSAIQAARVERAKRILERLRGLDINISYNTIVVIAGGAVGRPKIAQAIFDQGYVRTVQEAFERYLGIDRPAYVDKYPLQPADAIRIIQKAGGIAALAHPVFARTDEILPELVDQGLRAIEVYHSKHDASDTRHFEQLAKKYGLLIVGGSDAHGKEVPVGAVRISYEFVERMKEELPNQGKFDDVHQKRKSPQAKMIDSQVFNNIPPAHTFESIEGWGMKTFEMGGKLVPKEE